MQMDQRVAIAWLGERACHDARLSGGKAAALSRLAERYSVPPGFCVTSSALFGVAPPISIPEHIREAIAGAYAVLSGRAPAVAVRSSAVDEDGALSSFAGVHETFLNVRGGGALLTAIERCLESFFSPRALAYRRGREAGSGEADDVRMAVLVQEQIAADVSIVAFSANPITGRRDETVITASWGLGESIVGGSVTPDTWIVGRSNWRLLDERIGDKRRMTVMTLDGCREVDVPRLMRNIPSLSKDQVGDVARLAAQLEERQGQPVDIECAIADGRLHLLQCRPITTLVSTADRVGQLPPASL